jgi:sterol desaturase/sphingolipid hydroxylase (fatty acid hydroxylase superfamily)
MKEIWQSVMASPVAQSYGVLVTVILGFLFIERLFPAERGQPVRSKFLTFQLTLLYFVITPFVVILPLYLYRTVAGATGGSLFAINFDTVSTGSQPVDWVLHYLLFPLIPFIIFDFFFYWTHRFQHVVPALWEQHRLHHMDESVYCISSGRHHWLEEGIRALTITLPMSLLVVFASTQAAVTALILTQWPIFIHANVRLPFGPLTPILVGPQLHRVHHSRDPKHVNKNFGAYVPLWDILFGTYCRPQPGEWPVTGIPSREVPRNLWDGVVMPFRAWFPGLATEGRKAMLAMTRRLRG